MSFSFLPSEVARLVLGYLEEQKCTTAYNEFLNTSKHLEECKGRSFLTQIMGMSLTDILDDYCAAHSYVLNAICDDRAKEQLKKHLNLLDKIKLSFDGIVHRQESTDVSPKNISQRTRRGSNSANSISTIHSEKSHNLSNNSSISAKDLEQNIDEPKCLNENLTESTNLADLPGHKEEIHPKQKGEKCLNNTSLNSKLICQQIFNKSLDDVSPNKTIKDKDLMDFRYTLGLMKQTDSLEKNSKAIVRRKGYKPRMCLSARKSNNENFLPNESISPRTMSTTLLDFPEFHRKIAENINKIKNERNSFNKTNLTDSKNSGLSVVRHECIDVSKNSNMLFDDFSEDINSVVKSIVDITTKDPIFDQIINELAESLENIPGSNSDIISRPDTSTPEINSSNAVSRTSSFGSYENDLKKYKDIQRMQKSKNPKPEISNLTESVSDTVVVSSNNQKSFPRKLKSKENSPRYPRGGKKMDILKANYGKNISQNSTEIISIDEKLPASPLPEASQPKVIILSNERVQTNIVSTSGPIIISNIESFNENNKVVSIPKSKITEENMLSTNITKKDLNCSDEIKDKQQSNDFIVEENSENIYFESEIVSSEFEVVNMPQIISINEEINTHYYENLPNGFIRLLPKIETHPDYPTFVEIEEPNKPNCEFQIIDAKGFGLFTSNVNSIAETSGSVPLILPTSYNSTVPIQAKHHITLNTNPANLQEINILNIDNSESIENQTSPRTNDGQLNNCVIIEINDSVEKSETNLKTPNGVNTVKKISSSTPRKSSHIRILDFSTPEKGNVGKRKAATSPKSTSYNFRNNRSSPKSKIQSKMRLFNPISEEQTTSVNDNNDIIILDPNSPLNKVKSGKKSTIEISYDEEIEDEKKLQNNSKNDPKKSKKSNSAHVPNLVKSKSSWDRDLRAMLGESYIKCNKDIKALNNTNKAKPKVSKASKPKNPDSSLENDAKRLEDALNKTQDNSVFDTTASKKNTSGSDKLINNEKVLLSKSDSSVPNIIDDLDLSTNTTLDDSQCATPKNILSDNLNTPAENLNFKPLKDSNSFHSSFSKKNQVNDLDNILDFPPESKKENHSSSTIKTKIGLKPNLHKFKLKIGPQMLSGKKYDAGMNTRIDLSNPYVLKDLGSTNDDPQNIEDNSKSSLEQDVLDSSLVTPELPREYRSNPAEVKCNLNSILETPLKTCILDSTMTTPRFLSPGIHSDPISMVKILGIPTPKFEDTPIMSKTPELSHTPGSFSSKKTDYSSGSSYYKPDEIDGNFLTDLTKEKKKPNIFSKSPRKKQSGPSSISKLMNFRRKVCGRPKKKSPVKKVQPAKKKVSTSKSKKDNSKPLPIKTTEYSLRSSTNLRKVSYENGKINIKKSPNGSTSKSNAKCSNVSKKNNAKYDSKKKSKCDIQTNKELKEDAMTEKSSKVSSKDKVENDIVKSDSKTPKVKFSTVIDDIFSINKNLMLPYINSPSKSKRKSSTPRKIHSLSSQIDGDYIDSSMEFHNLLKSNDKTINHQSNNLNEKSSNEPKLTSKDDTFKECFEIDMEKSRKFDSSAFEAQISKKLEESEIKPKLSKEISDYTDQDIDDCHTLVIPKLSTDFAKNDIYETSEKKSENGDLSKSNTLSAIVPEQVKQDVSNISPNKSSENDEMTINECLYNASSPLDESEPYLDITWSKHEAICHYEVSDYSLKKLPKQTETKGTIELEKLNMNVEVFDTQTDCMRVTSLKATNFVDLFDIQSDLKRKNKAQSLKKSSDKHNSKPKDKGDLRRSGLQMLMDDLSSTPESSPIKNIVVQRKAGDYIASDHLSSTSESSPIKNIVVQRKTGDYIASEHETALAIKSILVEDNNIFSPIKMKCKNLYSESPKNKTSNIAIEKRKRESESEDVTLKKPKSTDNTANNPYVFKNFDIEEVLSKLHGTD